MSPYSTLEARHQQRFALKAVAEFGVSRNVVVHDFHNDLPAQIGLACEINSPHSAFAEQPLDFIPTEKYPSNHGDDPLHETAPRKAAVRQA